MTQSLAAPDELEIVLAFVNTLNIEEGSDRLDSAGALAAWLVGQGLLEHGAQCTESDRVRAIAFREALRALLLANTEGDVPEADAVSVLNGVAASMPLRLSIAATGAARLQPDSDGVDASLARLLIIVYQAMETGRWSRMKACRNDTCQWAFYDQSKNQSRHWCDVREGSLQKAREYRRRRKRAGQSA